jgi:hypothetical protein
LVGSIITLLFRASSKFRLIYCFFLVKSWFFIEKVHILRITHFSKATKDRNLIFGMGVDANVKLCIQHFLFPGLSPTPLGKVGVGYDPRAWAIMHLICLVTLIINIYGLGWGSRSHFLYRFPNGVGLSPGNKKCWMHNFTLASTPIPNIKFLSFVALEKCVTAI